MVDLLWQVDGYLIKRAGVDVGVALHDPQVAAYLVELANADQLRQEQVGRDRAQRARHGVGVSAGERLDAERRGHGIDPETGEVR